jgi:hypothetical protein
VRNGDFWKSELFAKDALTERAKAKRKERERRARGERKDEGSRVKRE